jgi:alpha-tubulin suppressor-like RCC1 family protein
VAIAAGGSHNLGLKVDGSIFGWGHNNHGQATPPEGNDFVAIATGSGHSVALKSDGSIYSWGKNDRGQTISPDGNDFVAIAAGSFHNLALKSDGSIVCWGYNSNGQSTSPDGNDFVAIAAGGYHSLGLKSDGSIVGWGRDRYGQAAPPEEDDCVAIAAGFFHSLAIRGSIEVAMKFTPKTLNCTGRGKWVKAQFVLPADLMVEDVDSNIFGQIESPRVEADYMDVFVDEDGLVGIEMAFDRAALCDGLTDDASIETIKIK